MAGASTSSFAGFVSDIRMLVIGFVAFQSTHAPTFALREGAVICALVFLSKISTVRPQRSDWLLVGFALVGLFSLQWTQAETATELSAQNYLGFAAIFIGVRAVVCDRRSMVVTTVGFLAGCLLVVAQLLSQSAGVRIEFDSTAERIGVNGVNPNYLAYSLATGVALIILVWTMWKPGPLGKAALAVVLGLLYVGILQNGTRGALIGVVAALAWAGWQHLRPAAGFRGLWFAVIGINVVILTGLLDTVLQSRLGSSARDAGDLSGRLDVWPMAREAFADRPFLGLGAGAFTDLSPLKIAAHNVILDIGTGTGVVGVALFLAVIHQSLVVETRDADVHGRILTIGAFVAATAPLLSSGYWYESPAYWVAMGVFSRIGHVQLDSAGEALPRSLGELPPAISPR
jgi:O-antigen ligase